MNLLTIVDENGNTQTIETTDGHPFWVVTDEPDLSRAASSYSDGMYHGELGVTENGYWVEAKDLRVGDVFLGADGKLSTLTGVARVEQSGGIDVFNFTVEGNHNYFVLAKNYDLGQTCVLVHNTCAAEFMKPIARQTGKEGAKDIPSFAKGQFPIRGETAQKYAERVMSNQYGENWRRIVAEAGKSIKGPNSEYSEIFKYFRHFM